MLERLPSGHVEPIAPDVFLLSGATTDTALLQIEGDDIAIVREPLATDAVTPFDPVRVRLKEALVTRGQVVTDDGRPAPGTRLELSEIISVTEPDGRARPVKRLLTELPVDRDGGFALKGLGPLRYELLAMHPRLGRAAVLFQPDLKPLTVRLAAGPRVAGRVMRNGLPLARAQVEAAPLVEVYRTAADPLDVISPPGATAADGRFVLALSPGGAAEIRVSYQGSSIRVPLPAIPNGSTLDLGDIALPAAIAVRVSHTGGERCALQAAGPLGFTRMAIVEARAAGAGVSLLLLPEPGQWVLALQCGAERLAVQPPILDVPQQVTEWSAHITGVRRP
jgi:hypothetical protein